MENRIAGIRGIAAIENKLAVAPSEQRVDEIVGEDVAAALDRDLLVDAQDINVTVNNGIVTLEGAVPSWAAKRAAEEDASLTAGVTAVHNQLLVAP